MGLRLAMNCVCCILLWSLTVVNTTPLVKNIYGTSRSSLDYSTLKIEEKDLYVPPLQELADVIGAGLGNMFETVSATVTESPDLSQAPYNLTAQGISGNPKLIDIGGMAYILPYAQLDKLYDLATLVRHLDRAPGHLACGGAGSWPYINLNSEGIYDISVYEDHVEQSSHLVSVDPVYAAPGESGFKGHELPSNETRIAMLGNCLLSDGKPGQVIKIVAKKRIGEDDFITAIRETLMAHYGDKVIGLGGMFLLAKGKVIHHIMPQFSTTKMCSDEELNEWVHYFELNAPITHVGTLVTGDLGINLRSAHFHGWSAHGDGGHYHWDTTPEDVEYEAYFSVASSVIRVDEPPVTNLNSRANYC